MKAILAISGLLLAATITVQAQTSGDYKHPYGLTQSSKTKVAPAQTLRTKVAKVQRNYKNPQSEQSEVVVAAPGRGVETVTNPLTATDNYKRQNRVFENNTDALPSRETDIIVQDSTERNRKKD